MQKGVQFFDAVNQPLRLQEIQRAVDGRGHGVALCLFQFVEQLVGGERPVGFQHQAQHRAAQFRQLRAIPGAGGRGLIQPVLQVAFVGDRAPRNPCFIRQYIISPLR